MGDYIINATNLSGETGTIIADAGFRFTDVLNDINEAEIKISGTGVTKRSLLVIGSEIKIYRNGTLRFHGKIDNINTLVAGTIIAHVTGYIEFWLSREKGSYSNSPWQSTASATIFGDIIGESSYVSAGTVEAGLSIDFRLNTAQSLWNGITNLANKTTQDVQMDYANTEIDILDHRGSSTVVATFNEGKEIRNVRTTYGYPAGNHILVFGKGDGDNQITGTANDATSIATYGRIKRQIIDRSIISKTEANSLASAELAISKDPSKIYDFDVVNPNSSISTGDHIYLNAQDQDLVNEEVRIVGLEYGIMNGTEYLTAQVTNPALKRLIRRRNKILARLTKDQQDAGSYMQGATNFSSWGSGINAKTNYPLKIGFYVPAILQDEAGDLQVNSLTVDFDIDPFNSQYGTASFTGSDPQVQNSSGDQGADVTGDSGSTSPSVSGTSGSTTPSAAAGVSVWASYTMQYSISNNKSVCHVEENVVGDSAYYTTRVVGLYINFTGSTQTVDRSMESAAGTTYSSNYSLSNNSVIYYSSGETGTGNTSGYAYFWDDNYACSAVAGTQENIYDHQHGSHTHGDGSYAADSHSHSDNTYAAANHNHPDGSYDINAADLDYISISDGVGEAGSVNATGVTIYLDFWNGSSWVNKHSVVSANTIDSDLDITDSGTYPDAIGYWRVRIDTNSANADYVQGIVKMKFHLDS